VLEQIKNLANKTVAGVPYWAVAAAVCAVAYVGGFFGKKGSKWL
jgi:hypothetical protein